MVNRKPAGIQPYFTSHINEGICAASHDKYDEEQLNILNFIFIDIMEYIWTHSKMITDQLLVMTWPLHYIAANVSYGI